MEGRVGAGEPAWRVLISSGDSVKRRVGLRDLYVEARADKTRCYGSGQAWPSRYAGWALAELTLTENSWRLTSERDLDQQTNLQVVGSRNALVRVLFQLRGPAGDLFRL